MDCNTDEPPIVFKATLFSLSGVQPDRQKVMYKGAVIKVSSANLTVFAADDDDAAAADAATLYSIKNDGSPFL